MILIKIEVSSTEEENKSGKKQGRIEDKLLMEVGWIRYAYQIWSTGPAGDSWKKKFDQIISDN